MRKLVFGFVPLAILACILAVGCGGDDAQESTPSVTATAPSEDTPTATQTAIQTTTETATPGTPVAGTDALSDDELVRASLQDIEGYWAEAMPLLFNGMEYAPISGGFFPYSSAGGLPPAPCGSSYAEMAGNAFYCSLSDIVAWDEEALIPKQRENFGDFSIGIIMAHEIGHAIQARVAFGAVNTVTREQQADCYAGAWTAWVYNGNSKTFAADLDTLDRAVAGLFGLRDTPGSDSSGGAHGSAFDRVGAFQQGLQDGAAPCASYTDETVAATLVELPFTDAVDAQRNGNAPYEDTVQSTYIDLEDFWQTIFTAAGSTWTPLADVVTVPTDLMRAAYDGVGDFAVATLIGHEYAIEVEDQLGEPGTDLQKSLVADCLTGVWSASLFLRDRETSTLQLSPGDLDEAIQALLLLGDPASAVESGESNVGSAFMRTFAFRTGFLSGIAECAKITEG